MSETLTPDICVIGAGSGGLTVAAAAASFGVPVVLIEKGEMGGDCLNTGCVPSKALIAAAKHAHAFSTGAPFGIAAQVPGIDFAKVNAHVHDVIAGIAPHDSQERFEGLGVTVIRAEARFTDRDTVVAGDTTIKARRFVIAAGSSPAVPPIDGLVDVPYLTNETVFDLKECPQHLIIVGGGPIGMEMAQAHRRLGANVTVLEATKALPKDDPENAKIVLDTIRAEGVDLREGVTVKSVASDGAGVIVTVETGEGTEERIAGSHILVAAGRRPNLAGLNLEAAGIAADKKGITVDAGLRTSNRRAYAIGDIAGGLQFTHVAGYHAGLVIRSILFRLPVKVKTPIIPWVTYTDPELAQIGPDRGCRPQGVRRCRHRPYRPLHRQRPRPRREAHRRPHQGDCREGRAHPRGQHRRRLGRRADRNLGPCRLRRPEAARPHRLRRPIPHFFRGLAPRRRRLLCPRRKESLGPAPRPLAPGLWISRDRY